MLFPVAVAIKPMPRVQKQKFPIHCLLASNKNGKRYSYVSYIMADFKSERRWRAETRTTGKNGLATKKDTVCAKCFFPSG